MLAWDLFSPARGYGWAAAPNAYDGGRDALTDDGAWGVDSTFQVIVDRTIAHTVTVWLGDLWAARDTIYVYAEGVPHGPYNTAQALAQQFTFSLPANTVGADGILDLRIVDGAGWDPYFTISAVQIATPLQAGPWSVVRGPLSVVSWPGAGVSCHRSPCHLVIC